MDATTVAIDLAKNVFQVALANRVGRIIDRQRLTRRQFERFLETLTDDIEVIMESCGTSHYWGRRIQSRVFVCGCFRCSTCDRTCVDTRRTAPTPTRCSRLRAAGD